MSAPSWGSRCRALLLLAALAGCGVQPPSRPPVPPVVDVEGVRQVFALPPGDRGDQRLIETLRSFAGGRMDALHVALPPGPAMAGLAWQLQLAGVMPRKIRRDPLLATAREVVAVRYIALVPPCPALDLTGGAFGANYTRPGFGCALLADLAAQTSDPADLLGNDAAPTPYGDRAATPVARWLGFTTGAAAGAAAPSTQGAAPSGVSSALSGSATTSAQ